MARNKIALIGAGNIGGTLAHLARRRSWAMSSCSTSSRAFPTARRWILRNCGPVEGFDVNLKGTKSYRDIKGADVCIVTAGVARKPGMSRDDLLNINLKVMKSVGEASRSMLPRLS